MTPMLILHWMKITLTCHVPIECRFQPPEAAVTSAEECGAAATHKGYTFTNVILNGVPCQPTAANVDNECLEHSFASLSAVSEE